VKFGFLVDQDSTRYCYLRLRRLKAAVKDSRIVDLLAEELEVSGATPKAKMMAVERRIEQLRSATSSLWYEVPGPEILAALIFKARGRAAGIVDDLFARVRRVEDLAAPLVSWVSLAGLTPYEGGEPGTGRANLLGFRGGRFISAPRIVGIEATNDAIDLERALDDMKASREPTHASYIACTPALAAELLWAQATASRAPRWEVDALRRRLRAVGCGLLLVEGSAVAQALVPEERNQDKAKLAQLARAVQSARKAAVNTSARH